MLNAKVIPDGRGDTMWASLFAAYDALVAGDAGPLRRLTVRHHSGADFQERVARTMGDEVAERTWPCSRRSSTRSCAPTPSPAARAVPVGRFMDQIVGMHRDESDALLGYLSRHIEDPNFQVRWHWTAVTSRSGTKRAPTTARSPDHYPRAPRHAAVHGRRHVALLPR